MEKAESLNAILERPKQIESESKTIAPLQTTSKEKKEVVIDENRLIIGVNDKSKDLFIPEKSRFLNTLVIGTKGTGKTTSVLPMFVEQDLKRKNAGVTIISSSKEMSYNIYSLAKKYKRKINFIKPSINNEVTNRFLWLKDYNYDYINENIINYKEAIKKKEVVIIDMEIMKYKSDALKAVAMLLLQLRLDIQETDITQRCHHFLYVDDAYNYLKFLEDLLTFSDNFNLGITLFMQSRNQFIAKTKDFTSLISNNVRNTLLLNNITMEDYFYYKEKFSEKNINDFFNREFNSMLYESIDSMGIRRVGVAKFKKLLIGDWNELEAKSKRIRATLLKEKRKEREAELKEKYQKSLEIQKIKNNEEMNSSLEIKTIIKEEQKTIPTKEPKPLDKKLIQDLTIPNVEPLSIKPREFNIKTKNESKKQQITAGAKPSFNPPKTNYDLALEQEKKHKTISLFDNMDDLGSIKPKIKPSLTDKKEKTETATKKDDKQNSVIDQQVTVKNNVKKQEMLQHSEESKNEKQNNLKQEEKKESTKIEEKKPVSSVNSEKNTIEVKTVNEPKSIPSLEEIKKQEEEAIKIQQEIEAKIQEQILNEEKERKRLVATRIFNTYNENIDYCDEVFDFKYE